MSWKLNRMSVMDMSLPGGILHLVKEAWCGKDSGVGYSECRAKTLFSS